MLEEASGEVGSGRDWEAEIRAGFHVAPPIATLHIHIISTAFGNNMGQLRTGREHLAVSTGFFAAIHEVPLVTDDRQ
jgi:hypothetical protein